MMSECEQQTVWLVWMDDEKGVVLPFSVYDNFAAAQEEARIRSIRRVVGDDDQEWISCGKYSGFWFRPTGKSFLGYGNPGFHATRMHVKHIPEMPEIERV